MAVEVYILKEVHIVQSVFEAHFFKKHMFNPWVTVKVMAHHTMCYSYNTMFACEGLFKIRDKHYYLAICTESLITHARYC